LETLKKGITNLCILFLCTGFLGVGMLKLVSYPSMIESFSKWGISSILMYVLGLFELALAVGIFYKPTRKYAVIGGLILMAGAIYIHISYDEMSQLYGPIFVTALFITLFITDDLI
jgi:hypothetical protein